MQQKKIFILCFVLFISEFINSQSLTGMTGYFNIPSADIVEDGQVKVGSSYLNKKYLKYANGIKNVVVIYLTCGYIPNFEISGRLTRLLDYHEGNHNFDRFASVKFKFVLESIYLPALSIGLHNPISGLEDANHFNSTYIVSTKNFYIDEFSLRFSITIGHGFDWIKAADHQFIGTFGGFLFRFGNEPNNIELIVDNDAERWNGGIRIKLLGLISLMGGFQGMHIFSGNVGVNFSL